VPHFTQKILPAAGPLLQLYVLVSIPREMALRAAGAAIPPPQQIFGLVDTGASNTCIDDDVITALGLTPTGTTLVHTPSTTASAPATKSNYDVRIIIPGAVGSPSFLLPALPVTQVSLKHQGFQALVGRDILSNCLLVYDGRTNIFTLAF
jgi:hypothetical protein